MTGLKVLSFIGLFQICFGFVLVMLVKKTIFVEGVTAARNKWAEVT
jgi:hypothetical protein